MFTRLAEEEIEHIQTLQNKVRFLQPAISGKGKSRRHLDLFVSNELKGEIFPASETKAVQNFKSDTEALEFGIESEKRSIEVLSSLLENEEKLDVKAIFSHLMVEEKKHLALLEGLKKKNLILGVDVELKLPLLLGVVRYAGNAKKNRLLISNKSSVRVVIGRGKPRFDDLPGSLSGINSRFNLLRRLLRTSSGKRPKHFNY